MPITTTGQLNKRITFFSKSKKINEETGAQKPTTKKELERWASVKTQFLKDIQANIGTKFEDTVTFVIRQTNKTIKNDWLIEYQKESYEIVTINPDPERQDFIVIVAKRK